MEHKTRADGYYIIVKNNKGYPSKYVALKITDNNTSISWFGGGSSTRTAVFKKWQTAYNFGKREIRRLNKKYEGDFVMIIQSISIIL